MAEFAHSPARWPVVRLQFLGHPVCIRQTKRLSTGITSAVNGHDGEPAKSSGKRSFFIVANPDHLLIGVSSGRRIFHARLSGCDQRVISGGTASGHLPSYIPRSEAPIPGKRPSARNPLWSIFLQTILKYRNKETKSGCLWLIRRCRSFVNHDSHCDTALGTGCTGTSH